MSAVDIRCLCGAVTVRLEGEALAHLYCHCDDCQRAHGAPYVPRALFPRDAVSVIAGETRSWLNRMRTMVICPACGAHLFAGAEGAPVRGVNGALLPPGAFKPIAHIYCRYAVAPVVDSLPHYRDIPAEYGGTGQLIGW